MISEKSTVRNPERAERSSKHVQLRCGLMVASGFRKVWSYTLNLPKIHPELPPVDNTKKSILKRELVRLKWQFLSPYTRIKFRLIRNGYDAIWPLQLKITNGDMSLKDKLAIYVVFQPNGLSESTVETCADLAYNGYSVVVSSNKYLQERDLERLRPHVFCIIERPNYGYDAGGYRDGLRYAVKNGFRPQHLLLLNDSIWWPLSQTDEILPHLEARKYNLKALTLKTRPKEEFNFNRTHRDFVEAYFYLFSFMTSDDFNKLKRIMERLPMTIGRHFLVEGRLSFYSRRVGLSIDRERTREEFLAKVENFSDDELRNTINYSAYSKKSFREQSNEYLAGTPDTIWRSSVIKHISEVVSKDSFNNVFPYGTHKSLGLYFFKKRNIGGLKAYRRAINDGAMPPPRYTVLSEIDSILSAHD